MNMAFTIALDEWRYWVRSRLAAAAALLALILVATAMVATMNQIAAEREARQTLQVKAEEVFRDQPARHPHRMVHYGHYVFRTPAPLAALDPGVDPYTGTVMFLEGHRQNSATFSPAYDGAQAGPFAGLTPALTYQLLIPLVLIIIGFGSVSREREAGMDRQMVTSGVSPTTVWAGKTLSLMGVAGLLLLPMSIGIVLAEGAAIVSMVFLSLYIIYLIIWVLMITAASVWSRLPATALLLLLSAWIALCILAPRLVASAASVTIPTASQIETDMDLVVQLRRVGDGHNTGDQAFDQLRANLLEQYGVERVEDLPVNFRGIVSLFAEEKQTAIMNEYAEKRMAREAAQADFARSLGFLSPFMAVQGSSMIAAGTDVRTHHRFLREAEAARFQFVQGLNTVHAEDLAYADDVNRNSDHEAEKRTRMSAENWRLLDDFRFAPDPPGKRLVQILPGLLMLALWAFGAALLGWVGARRLPEVDNG